MSGRWIECSRLQAPIVTLYAHGACVCVTAAGCELRARCGCSPRLMRHAPVADRECGVGTALPMLWLPLCLSPRRPQAAFGACFFLQQAANDERAKGCVSVLVLRFRVGAPCPRGRPRACNRLHTVALSDVRCSCSGLRSHLADAALGADCERRARSRLRVVLERRHAAAGAVAQYAAGCAWCLWLCCCSRLHKMSARRPALPCCCSLHPRARGCGCGYTSASTPRDNIQGCIVRCTALLSSQGTAECLRTLFDRHDDYCSAAFGGELIRISTTAWASSLVASCVGVLPPRAAARATPRDHRAYQPEQPEHRFSMRRPCHP